MRFSERFRPNDTSGEFDQRIAPVVPVEEPQIPPNITPRRWASSHKGGETDSMRIRVRRIAGDIDEVGALRNNNLQSAESKKYLYLVYNSGEFILPYYTVMRALPDLLQEAYRANLRSPFVAPEYLDSLDKVDVFSDKSAGTSLLEVEQMRLPLSRQDRRSIDRMFNSPRWTGKKNKEEKQRIREAMFLLAVYPYANPGKEFSVPKNLEPLHRRLTDYLDKYVSFFMGDLNVVSFRDFVDDGIGIARGGTSLINVIVAYLPARLGISPSSAAKIFEDRFLSVTKKVSPWSKTTKRIREQARRVLKKGLLPPELEEYMYFDKDADDKAADIITKHFAGFDAKRQNAEVDKVQEFSDRLNLYRPRLGKDLRKNPDHRLDIEVSPQMDWVHSITLAQVYRQTLIFIVKIGDAHVTIEVDNKGNVYGVPLKAVRENPHIGQLLGSEILETVLGKLSKIYPDIEKRRDQAVSVTPDVQNGQKLKIPWDYKPVRDKQPTVPVKPSASVPVDISQSGMQIPMEQRRNTVFHSRQEVEGFLGKRVNTKDIDKIMAALNRFENGLMPVKMISSSEGKWTRMHVGRNLVVVLEHLGDGKYAIAGVEDRKRVYNHTPFADKTV